MKEIRVSKKLLGYVLFTVGVIPLLLAIYLMIQGMTNYLISMFYPQLVYSVISFIVGIGFMIALFYGLYLIRNSGKVS